MDVRERYRNKYICSFDQESTSELVKSEMLIVVFDKVDSIHCDFVSHSQTVRRHVYMNVMKCLRELMR